MNNEIKFEQVVSDIISVINSIEYENDVHKELLKHEILQVIYRITESIETLQDVIEILNIKERIKKVK